MATTTRQARTVRRVTAGPRYANRPAMRAEERGETALQPSDGRFRERTRVRAHAWDAGIFFSVMLLLAIGLVALFSASYSTGYYNFKGDSLHFEMCIRDSDRRNGMKLQELLAGVAVQSRTAAPELEIGEVRYDSRAVEKGDLFVAIRGYATDGHRYIEKALAQGAAAIVCEEAPAGAPAVVVENSRRALAEIAANRFGHPADSMVMLGVTGTNGKTRCV